MVFDDCCFVVRLFSMWRLVPGALLPVLFELASPVVPCEDRPEETIPLLLCSDLLTDAADGIQRVSGAEASATVSATPYCPQQPELLTRGASLALAITHDSDPESH